MARNTVPNTHEDFRIEIDRRFREFIDDADELEYDFPCNYSTSAQRYIYERCKTLDLNLRSQGKEPNRVLTVYKPKNRACNVNLCRPAFDILSKYMKRNSHIVPQQIEAFNSVKYENAVGRLFFGNPVVVDPVVNNKFADVQQSLPTYHMKKEILDVIKNNKITIISAETGSGKTTQIPQYILENAAESRKPCRIICTQPRRISTVAIAERVSAERGEHLGLSVGFQIKLESKLGPKTALIYCTTGILLRTLMTNASCLNFVTHLIIDEIHERDKFTDFLLIYLKETIDKFKNLKIVLMSATMDINLFVEYFNNKPATLSIPGRNYAITEWFIDDILYLINYISDAMQTVAKGDNINTELANIDAETLKEMDVTLLNCVNFGREEDFSQLLHLLIDEKVPVNYSDICFAYTPLMVAAAKGQKEIVEKLLQMGASVTPKCKNNHTAAAYASSYGHREIAEILDWVVAESRKELRNADLIEIYDKTVSDDTIDYDLIVAIILYIQKNINSEDGILIFLPGYDDIINCCDKICNSSINQDDIKICMLHGGMHINAQHEVFSPAPEKQKIILSTNVAETSITIDNVAFVINSGKVKEKSYESIGGTSSLVTKWASMACVRQRAGRAGRTKPGECFHLLTKKRYDSLQIHTVPEILRVPLQELCLQTKLLAPSDSSIETFLLKAIEQPAKNSISTAVSGLKTLGALDANENLTKLGTHLLQLSVEPHLGKMLIYSVIFKCVDPVLTIVATLAHNGRLLNSAEEDGLVSRIAHIIVNQMFFFVIIWSKHCLFKAPIYREFQHRRSETEKLEPFILPSTGTEKGQANSKRKSLSFGSLSDHMILLKAFQLWQKSKQQKRERYFCQEYFISYGTMEMIMITRNHLLGQLRACGFVSSGKDSIQELSRFSDHWPLVKAVLVAALYPNIAFPNLDKLQTMTENKVLMHSSSALRNNLTNVDVWVVFEEISKIGSMCNIKIGTAVTPATVLLCCGSLIRYDEETGNVSIDDKLHIHINSPLIWKFRLLLDNLILRKIRNPRLKISNHEEQILETFDNILSAEDAAKKLFYPAGVGDRPLFIYNKTTDYVPYQNDNSGYVTASYNCEKYDRTNSQRYTANHANDQGISYSRHPYKAVTQNCSTYIYNDLSTSNRAHEHERPPSSPNGGGNFSYRVPTHYKEFSTPFLVNAIAPKNVVIPSNARFFVIRPTEIRNIIISVSQATWNFSPQTERKIFRLHMEGYFIVLLFTVRGTFYFQGIATLLDTNKGEPNIPSPIEWLGTQPVNYDDVKHLVHPKIHMAEDGYELEYSVGYDISCRLMRNKEPNSDISRPILGRKQNQY